MPCFVSMIFDTPNSVDCSKNKEKKAKNDREKYPLLIARKISSLKESFDIIDYKSKVIVNRLVMITGIS